MKCPECGDAARKLIGSEWIVGREAQRLRRLCKCGHRFTTYEVYEKSAGDFELKPPGRGGIKMDDVGCVSPSTRLSYGRIIMACLEQDNYDDVATATGYASSACIAAAAQRIKDDTAELKEAGLGMCQIAAKYGIKEELLGLYLNGRVTARTSNRVKQILRLSQILDEDGVPLKLNVIYQRLRAMGIKCAKGYVTQIQSELFIEGHSVPRLERAAERNPARYSGLMSLRNQSLSRLNGAAKVVDGQEQEPKPSSQMASSFSI